MKHTHRAVAVAAIALLTLGCAQSNAQIPPPGAPAQPGAPIRPMPPRPGMPGMPEQMQPGGPPGPMMDRMMRREMRRGPAQEHPPGEHIEGWLAFLKVEIKITAAQERAWTRFAQTAREVTESDRREVQEERTKRQTNQSPRDLSLVDRLKEREIRTAATLDRQRKVRAAIEPLYATFTDEQKRNADELLPRVLGPADNAGPAPRGDQRRFQPPRPMPNRTPPPPPR